jgi:dipeptidyl aminopeptidase/acylaminoacyl peptidase
MAALVSVGLVVALIATAATVRSDKPRVDVNAAAEPGVGSVGIGPASTSPSSTTATTSIAASTTTTTARVVPSTTTPTAAPTPTTRPLPPSILGRVVFSSDRDLYGVSRDFDIWVMDADGDNARNLTKSFGSDQTPDLSPDGRSIVWTRILDGGNRSPLMIMNSDGSDQRQLVAATSTLVPPRWSPDGDRILYAGQGGLRTIRPDATDDQLVLPASVINVWSASWSPDGTRLVVEPAVGCPCDDGIWVVDLATKAKTRVFTQIGERPAWSPTGDVIAFSGGPDRSIFTVRPDGTGLTPLTSFGPSNDNSTWNSDLAWSADGARLLFTHGQGGGDIWEMTRDGSAAHKVSDVHSRDREATF